MTKSFLSRFGHKLMDQGYPIIPIRNGYKYPRGIDDWQHTVANDAMLHKWKSNGFADGGVGVLTEHFPAVDLDVRDQVVVEKLVGWCEDNIGHTVHRVGHAPKILLAYRTEDPFTKIASAKYEDIFGLEHKVEILGIGQQYVAYANHPDTGKPYTWTTDRSLVEIPADDLPLITKDQAVNLVAYFESIIPEDWSIVERAPTATNVDTSIPEGERVLAHSKPKVQIPESELKAAIEAVDPDIRMNDWVRVGMALFHQYDGEDDGFHLWDDWSSGGAKYRPTEMRARWRSFEANLANTNPVTVATILHLAKEARGDLADQEEDSGTDAFWPASSLEGKDVPPREWLVEGLIPQKTVTLFGGDGGTGKSLLALQLAVAVAAGTEWVGHTPQGGPALYLSAEDDDDELHRRLNAIVGHSMLDYGDLDALTLRSLAGKEALLAVDSPTALKTSALFEVVDQKLAELQPAVLVLDTLADLFPANENDRAKVRQFVGMLRGLAIRHECAVLLLSHPSLSGLNSGAGTSGSTAWNNSVRSRLYLSRISDEGYEPNPDARILETKKANYGRVGGVINLRWSDGVFVFDPDHMPPSEDGESGDKPLDVNARAERVFMELLEEFTGQGRRVNAAGAASYAPRIFAEHPKGGGITKRMFKAAMDRLFSEEKIRIGHEGPPSRRVSFLEVAA